MTFFLNLFGVIILLLSTYSFTISGMDNSIGHPFSPQPHSIVYAPWRENYVNLVSTTQKAMAKQCAFCHIVSNKNDPLKTNRVIYWADHSLVMLASQPYIENGIHLLIVPYQHIREICDLPLKTYNEENVLTQKLCAIFGQDHHEIYINTNQGLSAGASIPDHHHKHIIINKSPRYYNLIQAIEQTKTTINVESLARNIKEQAKLLETISLPKILSNNSTNKNCYHCSIIQNCNQDSGSMSKNLIIHRGKNVSVMLSHYPTYWGEIDIMPHDHIESLETMPLEIYEEINELTLKIYPLLLTLLKTPDSNIGLISYGPDAPHKEHIKHKIIPRNRSWNTTPITEAHHISANIKKFYLKLLSAWQLLLFSQKKPLQSSKL